MSIQQSANGNPQKSLASSSTSIVGVGEMADLVRFFDWSSTALGPLQGWSRDLLSLVNMLLSSPDPMLIYWGTDLTLIYNDAARPIASSKHPGAIGGRAQDVWREAWHIVGPDVDRALTEGKATQRKGVLVPLETDGKLQELYWNYSYSPIYENGQVAGTLLCCQNITDAVLTAKALSEAEAQSARILQSIGDAVIVTDADTRIARMNTVAETLTGWTQSEAHNRLLGDILKLVNEETRQTVENPADKVKRLGTIVGLSNHTILVARNGTETHIDDSAAPIRDDSGQLSGIVFVFHAITERRLAERELAAVTERLQIALSAADGIGIWDWDVKQNCVYTDARFAVLYGVDPEKAVHGMPIADFMQNFHEKDVERVSSAITRAMETGEEYEAEYRLVQPDGSIRWVAAKGRCSFDKDGKPVRFPGVTVDITRRKVTEYALRGSEERLTIAAETASLGTWELDLGTGRMQCSELCKANYGRTSQEVFNYSDLRASIHSDDAPLMQAAVDEANANHSVYQCEYRITWPDGSLHWVVASGRASYNEAGDAIRMSGVSMDVTERHQVQAALMQTEKLAAVGRLAASIAHEINNPLESVTNLLYLARASKSFSEVQEYLDTAERELRRVSVISNQTLRFYKQSTNATAVTCEELFESVLSIYQGRLVNARVEVEKRKRAKNLFTIF